MEKTGTPDAAFSSGLSMEESDSSGQAASSNPKEIPGFRFVRAGDKDGEFLDWETGINQARTWLSDALNAKNVAFLMGAGCSSLKVEGVEKGIPTMAPLAEDFLKPLAYAEELDSVGENDPHPDSELPTPWEWNYLLQNFGINIRAGEFAANLERLMELLHSLRFIFTRSSLEIKESHVKVIDSIIGKVQNFLWQNCTKKELSESDNPVLSIYQRFYRKLVLRDRSLPRPWIFTTNYDLFNETAMDRLGIPYANGFSGVVERRFNPATFRYALAEQLDLTNRKWTAVDSFVYLCKLHGSIVWSEDDQGLFPIRESLPAGEAPGKIMIYPTPAKQNSSLGSPYADLFREFQGRIVREQSILFTMGYAFGDEHINNIIFQGLTIPTFRLIVFANPETTEGPIAKLMALEDPRIWIIGGKGPSGRGSAHYFDGIVDYFMPELPNERISEAVEKVWKQLVSRPKEDALGEDAAIHRTERVE